MTLADERLKELDSHSLTENERVLLRCRVAADLIHKGQYEAAREALGELWLGIGRRPAARKRSPAVESEVLLQCDTLTGWLGSARNISGPQEQAKDMLSEAVRKFRSQRMFAKVSEAQYELGICYWRLGAHDEARVVCVRVGRHPARADYAGRADVPRPPAHVRHPAGRARGRRDGEDGALRSVEYEDGSQVQSCDAGGDAGGRAKA